MTRLFDMQAAAVQLDRLPPGTMVSIGNDGTGPDPAEIRCRVVLPDGVTIGSALGDTWEEVARCVADALSCDLLIPMPPPKPTASLVASLRLFGEMPLEDDCADPAIEVMNSLAHQAADEIERLVALTGSESKDPG